MDYKTDLVDLRQGDCLEVLKTLPDCSVSVVVTDPPYGLSDHSPEDVTDCLTAWLAGQEYKPKKRGFMGKTWDAWVPSPTLWKEVYRVLKPGGHLAVFAGTRTHDLMGIALRLAGFELRDTVMWVYGSGFPKSLDVGKALDKKAGAEREPVGKANSSAKRTKTTFHGAEYKGGFTTKAEGERFITAPATKDAKLWNGFGTALKPAFEPILIFRKPLDGTVTDNCLKHGVGAMNIDGCRIGANPGYKYVAEKNGTTFHGKQGERIQRTEDKAGREFIESSKGRWPANVLLSHSPGCKKIETKKVEATGAFPKDVDQSNKKIYGKYASEHREVRAGMGDANGQETVEDWECVDGCPIKMFPDSKSTGGSGNASMGGLVKNVYGAYALNVKAANLGGLGDSGSAARFFYTAKTSGAERHLGTADEVAGNKHPTVKPLALMRYLIKLLSGPEPGLVLDPFMGSGTTGMACLLENQRFLGIEREAEYFTIAQARVSYVEQNRQHFEALLKAEESDGQPQRLDARAVKQRVADNEMSGGIFDLGDEQ